MMTIRQLKKSDPELRTMASAILVAMGILAAGLWYVQIYSSKRYWKDLRQQSFRTVRIPAPRGKILDRNGFALAENRPSYDVNLYLKEIRTQFHREFDHAESLIRRQHPEFKMTPQFRANLGKRTRYLAASNLVQELGHLMGTDLKLDESRFTRHYTQRRSLPMPVMEDIPLEEAARFLESSKKPPGFDLDIQPLRRYPYREAGAHLLGFMRRIAVTGDPEDIPAKYKLLDFKGVVGLEAVFDEALRGKAGIKSVMVNSLGYREEESILTPTVPGDNLVLTIDLPIQLAAEEAMRSNGEETKGAAVVMNPNNGDILALVSIPAYDPNLFIPGINREDWNRINDPERRCLSNRASYDIYQPGSIFKIIVGLAMLESGACNPEEIVQTRKYYTIGSHGWRDTAVPGRYDFQAAFKHSSNYYFIKFGLMTGRRAIVDMAKQFHLGESMELPTLQNHPGILPTDTWVRKHEAQGDPWTDGDTANISIGQGVVHVTPLQMAMMVSAVGNQGKVYRPRLVQRLESQESDGRGDPTRLFPPEMLSQAEVHGENLERIRRAMLADVEESDGTGRKARVPGMHIGGKTGTAETRGVRTITWFASLAPIDQPRYTVVIMVENGISGGTTCAPLARKIYEAIQIREQGRFPRPLHPIVTPPPSQS